MTRRVFAFAVGAAAALGMTAAAAPASAQATWQMQTLWSAGSLNQKIFEEFAENVRIASNGRIVIEPLPVGSIVGANEAVQAMRDGLLDGEHANLGYLAGTEPAVSMLVDMNMAYENVYQFEMWYDYHGGIDLARQVMSRWDAHWMGPVTWGAESIPAKFPIRNVAEFQGVKIRAPEGMGADIWGRVGAAVSTLPGTEVYSALEQGKIEATDWGSLGMNDDLGYDVIAPYAIYPGFHSFPMGEVAVANRHWNTLDDDLKQIVELAVRDFGRRLHHGNVVADFEAVGSRDPATLIDWSPEARAEIRAIARAVWADWAAKSPMAQTVYDSHIEWMTKIGLIR